MSHYISRSEVEGRQISAEHNVKRKTYGSSLLFHMTSSSLTLLTSRGIILSKNSNNGDTQLEANIF